VGFGYPFPAVVTWIAPNYGFNQLAFGTMNMEGKQVNRPMPAVMYDRILWPNLLANFVCYAVLLFGLVSIPSAIRLRRRRKHNLCLHCGYDLRGATLNVCSECGTTRGRYGPDDRALSPRAARSANVALRLLVLSTSVLFAWVLYGEYQRLAILAAA
jgi:hypothetical protein